MLKTEPMSDIMHFDAPLRFVDDCQTFLHEKQISFDIALKSTL